MAISPHFFNKREPVAAPARPGMATPNAGHHGAPGATAIPSAAATPTLTSPAASESATSGASKLTVGPNIKLKGVEITDCDTLVVEGLVEATMDSRVIHISECGAFRGSAEVDMAEIHGRFEGDLTVRQKLTIHATGKVAGKIRYGKVVIEDGGQLTGDIQSGVAAAPKTGAMERAGLPAAV